MKSGCPFMPSETKKTPGLSHFTQSYEFFLNNNKIIYLLLHIISSIFWKL